MRLKCIADNDLKDFRGDELKQVMIKYIESKGVQKTD